MRPYIEGSCRTMLLCVFLIVGAGHPAGAQRLRGTSVHGVVRDSLGLPVTGVEVAVAGSGMRARTNDSGAYHLAGLAPGPATLTARRIGYRVFRQELQLRDGDALTVDVHLSASAATLAGIHVTAPREP